MCSGRHLAPDLTTWTRRRWSYALRVQGVTIGVSGIAKHHSSWLTWPNQTSMIFTVPLLRTPLCERPAHTAVLNICARSCAFHADCCFSRQGLGVGARYDGRPCWPQRLRSHPSPAAAPPGPLAFAAVRCRQQWAGGLQLRSGLRRRGTASEGEADCQYRTSASRGLHGAPPRMVARTAVRACFRSSASSTSAIGRRAIVRKPRAQDWTAPGERCS